MQHPFEIIDFSFAGLSLQEPMALVTNWMITSFCIFAYLNIPWSSVYPSNKFKLFYLFLAISTFTGALGHAFFQYTGIYGKFPSWIFVILAGYQIGKGILYYWKDRKSYPFLNTFLWIKSSVLLLSSLLSLNFVFIAIDSILTYLTYGGYVCWKLVQNGREEMKYFVYGILALLPSAFIFLMNLNFHRYLNRDDLSHLLILSCIIFFYLGVKKSNQANFKEEFNT